MSKIDEIYDVRGEMTYLDVLAKVQKEMSVISTQRSYNISQMARDEIFRYKKDIEGCITKYKLKCKDIDKMSELVDRLYNTMTQYDVLTKYLDPNVYNELGIEEIYGRWNCIYLKTKDGKKRLKEKFPSKEIADTIFARITSHFNSNSNLNEGTPVVLGEFLPNIRASFVSTPITSLSDGTEFNIRIVHGSKMTRDFLLNTETVNAEGLQFLEMCIAHKIGIVTSGSTGSGKTGTMTYLLSTQTTDDKKRVGTIEIESREFDLIKYNEDGECINDVFHWVTRSSDDERYNITANDLVETILRFQPDIVGIGEMRNKEALIACEMGTTGHGVITSIHAECAADTPYRMAELMQKAGSTYDMTNLLMLAQKAFPIIVYQQKCIDNKSRKVYEIAEFVEVRDGKPIVNNIYEFVVQDTQVEKNITIGQFCKVGTISDGLRQRLRRNNVPNAIINQY